MKYPKVTNWDIIKEYWKTAKHHWVLFIFILLGDITGVLSFSVIGPIFYKKFFDTISIGLPSAELAHSLIEIVFIICAINIIGSLGFRLENFCINSYYVRIGRKLVDRAFGYLVDHSYTFFSNNFSGSLVQRVSRYHKTFGRLANNLFDDIIPLIIKVLGALIVLYFVYPIFAGFILIWIVVYMSFAYLSAKYKLKYDVIAASRDSKMVGVIADSISNHSSTQLFAGEIEELKKVNEVSDSWYEILWKRWNIGEWIRTIQSCIGICIELLVFYFGIRYWQEGLITLGTFVLMQAYVRTIGDTLWSFGRVIRDVYEAMSDVREMVEIIHTEHEIKDISGAQVLKVHKGAIHFNGINFAFGNNKAVFSGLNLTINPGEKVAIIGSSGAGKSTLVKLLLRLVDIQGGEIAIDNQDIKKVTQQSLRNAISLVPQDTALFHRTLMDNIRYGRRDASDEEVFEAARLAHCDTFIQDFPQKYETFVGERGIKLSGGERQRVAIARALLKNAPILVLDEATSSLDSHSEAMIQDALHTLMKGKTTIIIAHRLSTIRKVDRIIVLGRQGVIEEGNHEELVKKGGMYAHLWSLQAGGFTDKSIEELLDA